MADQSSGIFRSARQASATFGLDGPATPRQNNLFYVQFNRNQSVDSVLDPSSSSTVGIGGQSNWQTDLSFLVKSVERPAMTFTVEELNQYNKKRQIYTGYKNAPVRIVFYDTANSLAMQMWNEYVSNYVGDYGHEATRSDFLYDVTDNDFANSSGTGFGFSPTAVKNGSTDANAQFFFDSISVYQVHANEYVQFDLINPKITNFDPSEFAFGASEIATVSMTIAYEAILFKNSAIPQTFTSELTTTFSDLRLYGDGIEYPETDSTSSLGDSIPTNSFVSSLPFQNSFTSPAQIDLRTFDNSIGAGSLATYGTYNFGSISPNASSILNASGNIDLATMSLITPALSTTFNLSDQVLNGNSGNPTNILANPYAHQESLGQDTVDSAQASLNANNGGNDPSYYGDNIVGAALSAAIVAGNTPRDNIITAQTNPEDGIVLDTSVYNLVNANAKATAQIGFNTTFVK